MYYVSLRYFDYILILLRIHFKNHMPCIRERSNQECRFNSKAIDRDYHHLIIICVLHDFLTPLCEYESSVLTDNVSIGERRPVDSGLILARLYL